MGLHTRRTPSRILDILEMEQGWMTVDALQADLDLRFKPMSLETIRRAAHRLISSGYVAHRLVLMPSVRVGGHTHEMLELRAS